MTDSPLNGKDRAIVAAIKSNLKAGDACAHKAEQHYKQAGQKIIALRNARPGDWEKVVKEECGVGRSRAYELIALAGGKITLEKLREQKAQQVRDTRERANENPLRSGLGPRQFEEPAPACNADPVMLRRESFYIGIPFRNGINLT